MSPAPPRITLITGTFFPHPQVASVRMTNWARILAGRGWRVQVISKNHGYRAPQAFFDEKIGPGVEAHTLNGAGQVMPAPEHPTQPAAASAGPGGRLASLLVGTGISKLVVPDMQKVFWRRARPAIAHLVDTFSPDLVVTSSPQHSIHAVGLHLHRSGGRPWLVDYRDPHIIDPRFVSTGLGWLVRHWHTAFERSIYRQADAITHAIPLHGRWARMAYPAARKRCHILRHPVPPDMHPQGVRQETDRRSIRSVGYVGEAEAMLLVDAVSRLMAEDPQRFDLEIHFVGRVPDSLSELEAMLPGRIVAAGRQRHDLAKQSILNADVLINAVSIDRQRDIGISSKLYEYAAAGRPVVALNPRRADRPLLRQLPAATALRSPDAATLASTLRHVLHPDVARAAAVGDGAQAFRERHSWESHACQLIQVLEATIARPPRS